MHLNDVEENWDALGRTDPMWAILTDPKRSGPKWDSKAFFRTGAEMVRSVMDHLSSARIAVRKKRALDFGCGIGRLTLALADHFEQVCGVDIAPSMIQLANEYNFKADRCRYYLNRSGDLELFPDASFDFVLSIIVLQHLEPSYSKKYIKEFIRVLAPGGILVFQLPAARAGCVALVARVKSFVKRRCPPIVALYRLFQRARYGYEGVTEMYSVPRLQVTEWLEANGAEVLHVSPDDAAEGFISFTYYARKRRGT